MRVCAGGLRVATGCVLGLLWALGTSIALGGDILRVEEDWELKVAQPDPNTSGPQVTTVLSPTGNVQGLHVTFNLNHISLPTYSPGGLQLQVWNGPSSVAEKQSSTANVMSTAGETVTWTQCMEAAAGVLSFEVTQGNSQTWSTFGGLGTLKINVDSTMANLNGYSPSVSVANSAIGFASNRVQSLTLLRVRAITDEGQVLEDTTPRVVYQQEVQP